MLLPPILAFLSHNLSPRISKCQSEVPLPLSMCHIGTASIALRTMSAFILLSCPQVAVALTLAAAINIANKTL